MLVVGQWATLSRPAAAAAASPAQSGQVWIESFRAPLSGWAIQGRLTAARVGGDGDPALTLSRPGPVGRTISHRLPVKRWALSVDLALDPGTTLALGLGDRRRTLRLNRSKRGGRVVLRASAARSMPVSASANPPGGRWVHLQARSGPDGVKGAVNGLGFALPGRPGRRLHVTLERGRVRLDDLIATPAADPERLLLHRLADLHARVRPRSFVFGADEYDRLDLRTRSWTRGFLAGGLRQAALLTPRGDVFQGWAGERTVANFGRERADTHDLGFIYETASVAAYRDGCRTARRRAGKPCRRLRASALSAAEQLLALAATNPGVGTIPTRAAKPTPWESDTIIDSLMNLPLLYWASGETGDPRFREVAANHARHVAAVLVRPDGSTAQSVHHDRQTGQVVAIHTHQGISAESTWARGQAWAVYGLTTSAAALGDPHLLSVAERAAAWVAAHLPPSGVPRHDYLAPAEAGDATSAGVITAAGLFRLANLCGRWQNACARAEQWRPLAERMLAASLRHVSRSPPLGYLHRSADLDERVAGSAAEGERSYGLYYALEAVRLRGAR